jgi:hypothetical protein
VNLTQYYWNVVSARLQYGATPGHYAFNGAVFTTAHRTRLDRRRPIIVHLDHPLMHVGDQLFFRPLVWRLKQAGFDVSVTNRPSVDFMFADISRAEKKIHPGALVVLRHEALREAQRLYGPDADYFVIRQISRGIRRPVANFILEAVAEWFELPGLDQSIDKTCFRSLSVCPDTVLKQFGLPKMRPLIILSNYVDSGLHRKLPSRESAMRTQVRRLKHEAGGAVVHVGTGRDRQRDNRDYSRLVDHDLRGQTSVEDLFGLIGCRNVARVFCFDTAILHIAYVSNVPTTLFGKYYFSRAERSQKAAAFYKFFERPQVQAPQPA